MQENPCCVKQLTWLHAIHTPNPPTRYEQVFGWGFTCSANQVAPAACHQW
jgi:hypothetical protein